MARYPREWSIVIEDDECTDVRGKNLQFSYNNKVIAKIHMNRDHYRAVSNVETELFDEAAEFRLKQGIVSIDRKIAIYYNYVDGAENSLVVADIRGKRLLYCDGIPLEKVQHNVTVSYKADKRRWEGDVWENLPCGWGCWYDENEQLIFEGFRVKHDYVCYGTDYLPDGKIQYQGMMCGVKPSGFGSVSPGKEDIFNEWLSGHLVAFMSLDEDDNHIVNSRIEKLTLADQTGNDIHNTICISCFRKLRADHRLLLLPRRHWLRVLRPARAELHPYRREVLHRLDQVDTPAQRAARRALPVGELPKAAVTRHSALLLLRLRLLHSAQAARADHAHARREGYGRPLLRPRAALHHRWVFALFLISRPAHARSHHLRQGLLPVLAAQHHRQ